MTVFEWIEKHNKQPHKYEEYKINFDLETLEQLEKLQRMYYDRFHPGEMLALAVHLLTEKMVEETGSDRYRLSDHDKWCHQVYTSYPDREENA